MITKLVIFDFDGVIVNTEDAFLKKLYTVLQDAGLKIDFNEYFNLSVGNDTLTNLRKISNKYPLNTSVEDIYKNLPQIKKDIIKDIKKMPYIEELLNQLKLPYCIASNSNAKSIIATLDLIGLTKFFNKNNIFSAYTLNKFKPDPAVYLEALKTMGFSAQDTIAIEDSIPGVTAASSAKVNTIGFISSTHVDKTEHAKKLIKHGAFTTITSLKEVLPLINME